MLKLIAHHQSNIDGTIAEIFPKGPRNNQPSSQSGVWLRDAGMKYFILMTVRIVVLN